MEPFYTDYNDDYPDDWNGELPPVDESSGSTSTGPLVDVLVGATEAIGKICDALGLLPGARWMDGGL